MMPPALNEATPSHLVIQFDTDNPGGKYSSVSPTGCLWLTIFVVWPLHCHFAWHSSMGLVVNIVEHQEKLVKTLAGARSTVAGLCKSWDDWTKMNGKIMTGIDSGL